MTFALPDPGPPNRQFERPADRAGLERTAAALARRGFTARIADSAKEARQLVLEAIPEGAEVHSGLSETMRELGLTPEIDESSRYQAIRPRLNALDRVTQARDRRKLGAAPDYIIGSAHAVTDAGEIIVGSGSGSQLGAYAYAAGQVILVIGHQKLVRDLDEGLRRLREYSLPRNTRACKTPASPEACSPRRSSSTTSAPAGPPSSWSPTRSASNWPKRGAFCPGWSWFRAADRVEPLAASNSLIRGGIAQPPPRTERVRIPARC